MLQNNPGQASAVQTRPDLNVLLQVKELAAEVMEHLRSSLDGSALTQAFAEARARSSAVRMQRRKEAAVKVPAHPASLLHE